MVSTIVKIIGIMIVAAVLVYAILLAINPNPDRPAHVDSGTGFVQASGTNLYDGEGNLLQFKGVNLGNWFDQEYWMAVSAVGNFDTGVYTQLRGDAAMCNNPNLTNAQIDELNALYLDNYIQESDFQILAELGMNTVRIPFTYFNLSADGEHLRGNAFEKLDWAVSMCEKYGLYAIIDLHGAIGSQNMDIHSGDDSQFDLYGNEKNMRLTEELWKSLAAHYKDNKTVAAYDLLNEPRRAPHRFGGKINFDFYDRLYHAVRSVDENHLILIECFSFPFNGARLSHYDWQNICLEYHIYNLSPLSQLSCLRFYRAAHNLMGYRTPVYVGEWNAFEKESEWAD
ncbi:MAG: cellulase family glycosylhydrolase, partial [Oscillospiraceae bacterium]|nr:cellulase family glycosylhydrolase [Oscillospiraceae bacterium]